MSKTKVVLNTSNVKNQLLKSEWIAGICQQVGNNIANRAGSDYVVSTQSGRNRIHTRVAADSIEAVKDNLENNTLLKAVK